MTPDTRDADSAVRDHFARSLAVMERAAKDEALRLAILAIATACAKALHAGNKIMLAGNGGSAADAQHIAAEFLSRFKINRAPLAAIALTTDTSVLTAIGNDFGYDQVFERQVRGLGRRGDVFIGISTSGRSTNIIAALNAAREIGIITVGFSGARSGAREDMANLCDVTLAAPSDDTALIQQIHIVAAHAICGVVEAALAQP